MQNISQAPQFAEQEKLACPRCDSTNTKFCYYNNYNLSQPRHFCKSCKRYWTKGGALRNIPVGGGGRKNAKRPSAKQPASAAPAAASEEKNEETTFLPLTGDQHQGQFGIFQQEMGGKGHDFGQGHFGNFMEMGGGRDEAETLLPPLNMKGVDYFGQEQFGSFLGMGGGGNFGSLLGGGSSSGPHFGGLLDGMGSNGPSLRAGDEFSDLGLGQHVDPQADDGFLNIGGGGGWGGGGGNGGGWGGGEGGWPDLAI